MHRGGILEEGPPLDLISRHAGDSVLELRMPVDQRPALLAEVGNIPGVAIEEVEDIVYVFGAGAEAERIASRVGDPRLVFVRPGTLEDVFLRLTGRGLLD